MSKSPKQAMDVHSVVSADPRIKFVAENICKSCRKKHTANCCSEYSRGNRSKAEYIINARYSPNQIGE